MLAHMHRCMKILFSNSAFVSHMSQILYLLKCFSASEHGTQLIFMFNHTYTLTGQSLKSYLFVPNACVKGHLEPTHLKCSPLFTFSTKSLGQDSPSIHLFSKIIRSRFTTAKIKLGEDSPSLFVFSRSRFAFKQRKK